MKQVLSYLITAAILLHLFADLLVIVSFKINQDYIAEFLCINRDVPESTCNGCCHLKKELDEQHETKESTLPVNETKLEIQYIFNQAKEFISLEKPLKPKICFYQNIQGTLHAESIFHPPKCKLA